MVERMGVGRLARVLAVALGLGVAGCGVDERQCAGPGGALGPCCTLTLPGGVELEGACIDERCRRADQPALAPPCDGAGPGGDGAIVDLGGADGGGDGAPSDGGGGDDGLAPDAEGVDAGALDGGGPDGGDRCRVVVCDPGERCDPETGTCRSRQFGVPGGACDVDDDCATGRCLSEADSGGEAPGGFCAVPCVDDGDCGLGACVEAADGRVCFEPCDGRGACRAGWTCRPDAARPVCRVDCRVIGCPGQGRCDDETGVCGPPARACRYDCALGEQCLDGRCVRGDGTCVTDYHCRPTHICHDDRCVPAEYSPCDGEADCDPRQRCVAVEGGGGCLFACETDAACPADRVCRLDLGACVRPGCGGETGNGELLGGCAFGGDAPGTCLPYEVRTPGAAPGFCVEAGLAAAGEPCDAQTDGRTALDRAVQCASGAICRGDPDDPLDPMQRWEGRGTCAALCAPDVGGCAEGRCVDFGAADDPETPEDEARVVGLCLPVECEVLAEGCADDGRCRAYGLADRAGTCGPAGDAAAGEACRTDADCADEALCVSRGAGTECLVLCEPADADACGGRPCYADVGWRFGVCL